MPGIRVYQGYKISTLTLTLTYPTQNPGVFETPDNPYQFSIHPLPPSNECARRVQ